MWISTWWPAQEATMEAGTATVTLPQIIKMINFLGECNLDPYYLKHGFRLHTSQSFGNHWAKVDSAWFSQKTILSNLRFGPNEVVLKKWFGISYIVIPIKCALFLFPFPILFPCFLMVLMFSLSFLDGFPYLFLMVFPWFWWFSHDFDGFLMVFPWFFLHPGSPSFRTWVSLRLDSRFRSGRRGGRLRPAARGERRPSHTRLLDLAEDAPSLGEETWWFFMVVKNPWNLW